MLKGRPLVSNAACLSLTRCFVTCLGSMAPSRSKLGIPNFRYLSSNAYELIDKSLAHKRRKASSITLSSVNDACSTVHCEESAGISNLPPKRLKPCAKKRIYRRLAVVSLLAALSVVGLSLAIQRLSMVYSDTVSYTGNRFDSTGSCDLLITTGSGGFQDAFTLNVRGPAHLSYFEVKLIDVLWQLIVGAGGRLLLALVCYNVFMDGMTRFLERESLSYQMYASIAFDATSFLTMMRALKGIAITKGWRNECLFFWLFLSILYILGFQSFISAAGGYVTPSTMRYAMPDGTYIAGDSDDLTSCYTVINGSSIGFPNNALALGPLVHQFAVNTSPGLLTGDGDCGLSRLLGNMMNQPNSSIEYGLFLAIWKHRCKTILHQ